MQCLATTEKSETDSSMQSMRLREAVSSSLTDIHRHGLSGEYGPPTHLPGDSLVQTLADRLPIASASL